jgi:hypothetical protein
MLSFFNNIKAQGLSVVIPPVHTNFFTIKDIVMYLIFFIWLLKLKLNFPSPKPQSRGPQVIKEREKRRN